MKIFTVVGVSNSGKTTVIEALIQELRRRGCTVASAKSVNCGRSCTLRVNGVCHCTGGNHCGEFSIDTPGSNSSRHRLAGSQLVVTRAQAETAVMFQRELPLEELLSYFSAYDFVLLEGDYTSPLPRLVTGRGSADALERITPLTFAISGRVSGEAHTLEGLPVLDARTQTAALADLVQALPQRLPQEARDFALVAAGAELPLSPAARAILNQALWALEAAGQLPEGPCALTLGGRA